MRPPLPGRLQPREAVARLCGPQVWAIWATTWHLFVGALPFKLINDASTFVGPVFLNLLLGVVSAGQSSTLGYSYAALMFLRARAGHAVRQPALPARHARRCAPPAFQGFCVGGAGATPAALLFSTELWLCMLQCMRVLCVQLWQQSVRQDIAPAMPSVRVLNISFQGLNLF